MSDDIQQASERFYGALSQLVQGNPEPMAAVWSHRDDVSAMHPIGGREVGWEQVWQAWQGVSRALTDASVTVTDVTFHAAGDLAYAVGIEHGQGTIGGESVTFDARVTNIFRREGGEWKLVHHHVDTVPAFQQAIQRLMGKHR